MSATSTFDLSGLGVRLRGVPDDVAPLLAEAWRRYGAPTDDVFLDLEVAEGSGSLAPGSVLAPRMDARYGSGAAAFDADQGSIEVDAGGRGRVTLAQGDPGHRLYGLVNLILAALGWALARERGLVLHAAGAVLDGRAFLLVGPSGAGKTTWARAAAEAGAVVLSDDLVVVETGKTVEALSVPFRVRPFPPPPRGRWPVAALLLPRRGPQARLAPVPAMAAAAVLSASIRYVEPEVRTRLDGDGPLASLARLPVRELTFAPDPAFVPLLRSFDAAGS